VPGEQRRKQYQRIGKDIRDHEVRLEIRSRLRVDKSGVGPVTLGVRPRRDERIALKTSQAGRVMDRAGIAEVGALVRNDARPA